MNLIQDKDIWWTTVNIANELSVSLKCGQFLD